MDVHVRGARPHVPLTVETASLGPLFLGLQLNISTFRKKNGNTVQLNYSTQ